MEFTVGLYRDLLANKALRSHWGGRADLMADTKRSVDLIVRSERRKWQRRHNRPWTTRPIKVIAEPVCGKGGRMFDHDAIAIQLKAIIDGIAAAGLVPDDQPPWVRSEITGVARSPSRGDEIRITILAV